MQTAIPSFKTDSSETDGQRGEEDAGTLLGPFLSALQKDCKPLASEVESLLKELESGGPRSVAAAKDLMDRIPDLLPDDPAMAAVIAEEMAKAYGEAFTGASVVKNREYKREQNGQFSEVDHPRDHKPGINPDSAETQAAEIGKGKKAIEKCIAEKCDVYDAVSRGDVGMIGLVWGDDESGICKIARKHPDAIARLPDVLIRGEAGGTYQRGQKIDIKHGNYKATLALTNDPDDPARRTRPDKWVLTAFDETKEAK